MDAVSEHIGKPILLYSLIELFYGVPFMECPWREIGAWQWPALRPRVPYCLSAGASKDYLQVVLSHLSGDMVQVGL